MIAALHSGKDINLIAKTLVGGWSGSFVIIGEGFLSVRLAVRGIRDHCTEPV